MSVKKILSCGGIGYDPEPHEQENLEYAFRVCDDLVEGYGINPYCFFNRFCLERIKAPFDKKLFMENRDIVPTIEGFGLDLEKFWWAVLFIYDWTECKFMNCLSIESHSHGMMLTKFLNKLGDTWSDVKITVRKGRKNIEVGHFVKNDMLKALPPILEDLKRRGLSQFYAYRGDELFTENYNVSAYKMYFATMKFKELFRQLEFSKQLKKPKRKKGNWVSYNKMLLFSRIMYFYRYARKSSYLVSDEPLKAIMKDYKGRVPLTISQIYFD